jgi:hypothetical protein
LDEDEEVADETAVVDEPKPAAPVPPGDGAAPGPLFADAVPLARREFDKSDVADMIAERLVWLSVSEADDVVVAGVVVFDGLESVTKVPFKNETFRVDVNVSVTVLSEVFVAEELLPGGRDEVGSVDETRLFVGKEAPEDVNGDAPACDESDVVVVLPEALGWASIVTAPSEVKDITVASDAWRIRVLAMVVLPSWTLTSTAVARTVVSGARGTIRAAVSLPGRAFRPLLLELSKTYLRRRSYLLSVGVGTTGRPWTPSVFASACVQLTSPSCLAWSLG